MVSVLCALCVDTGTGQPCNPGDTRQIISSLVDLAFREYGENNPRLYRAGTEPLVDLAWKRAASLNNMMPDGGMPPPGLKSGTCCILQEYPRRPAGTLPGHAPAG